MGFRTRGEMSYLLSATLQSFYLWLTCNVGINSVV